ncbi:AraC family transcriptional regulator (plasmid) [Agrobacterium leguminum]|uniref:AraC family transcriptional regulator n=1 Tax=Agrobacterium leguminum TaxID=2792015 RepID=UPI00272B0AD0|nr:AraC family transcriptional regulator [Agrobacterium leguminum]WLE00740.1 AraC family transcriptional regulator [Agrobacterium leguminum]
MNDGAPSIIETARGREFPAAAQRLFGNVRLSFPHGGEDRSHLRSVMLGPCRLSQLQAETHTVFGDNVVTGSDNPDSVKLIVQTAGSSVLSQGGREAEVGGHHIVLYDPTQPYLLANRTAVRLLLLQLPRAVLRPSILQRLKEPFPIPARAAGLNRVLTSMMASTFSEIEELDDAMRRAVGDTMIDLVRNLAGGSTDDEDIGSPPLELLFRRIENYVADNLASPDLDVRRIARKMGCSERYVYRAFETRRTTPSDYIWSLRIEQAARRLRETHGRAGAISQIAFDLGFSSSAHFSRAFRSRYQMTPSDWRRKEGD